MAEAKNRFEIERKRDDNSKAFVQPVRSNMDSILYDHGINKSGAFGGVIYGNDCRRLISSSKSIVGELRVFPKSVQIFVSTTSLCDKIVSTGLTATNATNMTMMGDGNIRIGGGGVGA